MKAVFEQISTGAKTSFIHKYLELPAFDAPYHFHPAYELTWICKGKGIRYVGRNAQSFLDGDLVFLGANLPHCWINPGADETVSAHVIQFEENFLGKDFFGIPEMQVVKKLFEKSKSGLSVEGAVKNQIQEKILQLAKSNPIERITGILEILTLLGTSEDLKPLDVMVSRLSDDLPETARFNQVMSFLIENFKNNIELEQIADIAHLSPTSFCRYFKGIMQKTFTEVLLEFRIQHACQQLSNTDLPISQIAFESGFEDLPYFNRKFKKMTGTNPLGFRKENKLKKQLPKPAGRGVFFSDSMETKRLT
jgi:AraC-like DNA-binding protein